MDIYEELKAWLVGEGAVLEVDRCGQDSGAVGLFPQGVQVLRQWEDVLGNAHRRVRYSFLLRLVAPPGEAAALWLLRLQAAAAQKGYAAQGGKMKKAASDGLVTYEIRLTAEREEHL